MITRNFKARGCVTIMLQKIETDILFDAHHFCTDAAGRITSEIKQDFLNDRMKDYQVTVSSNMITCRSGTCTLFSRNNAILRPITDERVPHCSLLA
jgi:hypothetical protein